MLKVCRCKTHVGENPVPIAEFGKQTSSEDGYSNRCKACCYANHTKWRTKDLAKHATRQRKRRADVALQFSKWKSDRGCLFCTETTSVCLDLHHLNGATKENEVSSLVGRSWKVLMEEAGKCIVVCANCHRKIHSGDITEQQVLDGMGKCGVPSEL